MIRQNQKEIPTPKTEVGKKLNAVAVLVCTHNLCYEPNKQNIYFFYFLKKKKKTQLILFHFIILQVTKNFAWVCFLDVRVV